MYTTFPTEMKITIAGILEKPYFYEQAVISNLVFITIKQEQ